MFYVYTHARADTGEIFYVGKGTRGRLHCKDSRNAWWRNIVAKHGFTAEIVSRHDTELGALAAEESLIAKLSAAGTKLCNLTSGGRSNAGYKFSEESKAKMRLSANKRWTLDERTSFSIKKSIALSSPEARAKMSAIAKAQWEAGDGKQIAALKEFWSKEENRKAQSVRRKQYLRERPEAREAISQRAKIRLADPRKNPMARSVRCIETGQLFDVMKFALEWLHEVGIPKPDASNLTRCCRGKSHTAHGYHWEYVNAGDISAGIASRPD